MSVPPQPDRAATEGGLELEERPVRLYTLRGPIDGKLRISAHLRTLDDLNMVARAFLKIHEPRIQADDWADSRLPLAVSKDSIVFVTEKAAFQPIGERRRGGSRGGLTLRVADFLVRGFVHIPASGDPFMRLNQSKHPFLAVTSASVVGPEAHFATTFVAVNRRHVIGAQEIVEETVAQPCEADQAEIEI